MEMLQRLGMVVDSLHVTEVRQQSPVPDHATVLALRILKYHLKMKQKASASSHFCKQGCHTLTGSLIPLTASLTLSLTSFDEKYSIDFLFSASREFVSKLTKCQITSMMNDGYLDCRGQL